MISSEFVLVFQINDNSSIMIPKQQLLVKIRFGISMPLIRFQESKQDLICSSLLYKRETEIRVWLIHTF